MLSARKEAVSRGKDLVKPKKLPMTMRVE